MQSSRFGKAFRAKGGVGEISTVSLSTKLYRHSTRVVVPRGTADSHERERDVVRCISESMAQKNGFAKSKEKENKRDH
jgi:hypothetical protein